MWGYIFLVLKGSLVTLQIAFGSLAFAIALGLITASFSLSNKKYHRKIAKLYTTVIRGIPSLVMMYLIYYGFQNLLNDLLFRLGLRDLFIINSYVAGVFTIGFIYGAYMGETFRGAILSIDPGDIEAAESLGFGKYNLFVRIKLPQMIRHGFSSFENNWLVLLKDTSIISIIGIADMVYVAKNTGISIQQPFTLLFLVSILYLLFSTISSYGLNRIRSRYHFE